MQAGQIFQLSYDAIYLTLYIVTPVCCAAMAVGLIVSVIQAVTQIQEITLTFIPKLVVILFAMISLMPHYHNIMNTYFNEIINVIVHINTWS